MATRVRRSSKPRIEVGTRVGIPYSGWVQEAVVIEDRGDLGVDGEQIVRLRFTADGDEHETESSVTRLVPAPDPAQAIAPPRAPARRRTGARAR